MRRDDTHTAAARASRAGFTLAEMLLAVALFTVVLGATIPFFIAQARAVEKSAGRRDATQAGQGAIAMLERELRMAGDGTVAFQPSIVQADSLAVTINVDYVTKDPADIIAPHYRPDVVDELATGLPVSRAITLPRSTQSYPTAAYDITPGVTGPAQTISFWLQPDATPGALPNTWVMMRRANDLTAEVVARGIVLANGKPVFSYYTFDNVNGRAQIAPAKLPLLSTSTDTAVTNLLGRVRSMHVRLATVQRNTRKANDTTVRVVETDVRLANTGRVLSAVCGVPPAPTVLNAVRTGVAPNFSVRLTWPASADDNGGAKDVERYLIYRRLAGGAFTTPLMSTPGGLATYSIDDPSVVSGANTNYVYGVVAQDCSPSLSTVGTAAVNIP
jgi:prepilin-type N-terminal cleavage/methylation domain-containing protein